MSSNYMALESVYVCVCMCVSMCEYKYCEISQHLWIIWGCDTHLFNNIYEIPGMVSHFQIKAGK